MLTSSFRLKSLVGYYLAEIQTGGGSGFKGTESNKNDFE